MFDFSNVAGPGSFEGADFEGYILEVASNAGVSYDRDSFVKVDLLVGPLKLLGRSAEWTGISRGSAKALV
jgi:hypothetical protein